MQLENNNYELIFENWNTEDASNADYSKYFAYQYLYKSINKKCVIWISLTDES